MSNWPKDTTKGDAMTNKELATWICETFGGPMMSNQMIEIASRLRELPDPTPEPVKDLRWLVGRHECLSKVLRYRPDDIPGDGRPWSVVDPGKDHGVAWMSTDMATQHLRGIVKGLCDEQEDIYFDWNRRGGEWRITSGEGWIYFATELEALDALLTAMKEST